jgi:hypothetical protein
VRGWSFKTNINVVTMSLSTFFAEKVENQEKEDIAKRTEGREFSVFS